MRLRAPKLLAAIALLLELLPTSCSAGRLHFDGGSVNAPGYRLHREKADDTSVALGYLSNSSNSLKISYVIFGPRVAADPTALTNAGQRVIWTRQRVINGRLMIQTLAKDSLDQERLYISFPSAGPANFIVELSGQQAIAKKQILAADRVLLTFQPVPSSR